MSDLIHRLRELLGDDGVLTEVADLAGYRGDLAWPEGGDMICVARPRTTVETSAVVRACAASRVPIVPRGGGTGLTGGATPPPGARSLVLSFERMRRIRAIDTVDDAMIVEAGCPLAEAQAAAERQGRLLGLDHGASGSSQIGGNLSTNAGGTNVLRYGMARDQVLGLEVVLSDGEVLSDLSRLRKSNAGYDLKQLFVGSEGTLGLITAAALRLRPAPIRRVTLCLGLPSARAALDLLRLAREAFGEAITAFELMARSGLDLHFRHVGATREPFDPPAPWAVLLEADSASRHFDLDAAAEELLSLSLAEGIITAGVIAATEAQRLAFWRIREGIAEAMVATPGSLKSDTAVPVAAVPEAIRRTSEAVQRIVPGCIPVPFGHLGDGNIHFNVLAPLGMDPHAFAACGPELAHAIEDVALALIGTVSAEHGIGLSKRDALRRMRSPLHLHLMQGLKGVLDPCDRLNPGKVLGSRPSSSGVELRRSEFGQPS